MEFAVKDPTKETISSQLFKFSSPNLTTDPTGEQNCSIPVAFNKQLIFPSLYNAPLCGIFFSPKNNASSSDGKLEKQKGHLEGTGLKDEKC